MSRMNEAKRTSLLFNCTTNSTGGAVQNAANFIRHAAKSDIDWKYAVSPQVYEVLEKWGIHGDQIEVFTSPSRDLKARHRLQQFERSISVDLVYTMAGPAYAKFSRPHVLGISNPYITHATHEAFVMGESGVSAVIKYTTSLIRGLHARTEAIGWIFQTEASRCGFVRKYKAPFNQTFVVPNAIGKSFANLLDDAELSRQTSTRDRLIVFCPAADYPHKNLLIIPSIVEKLIRIDSASKVLFRVTLPQESTTWRHLWSEMERKGLERHIENIGPFSYADAAPLYLSSDVVFVPSILETFSTSYLEAMVTYRPLVVANREFAREICKGAAEYFDPYSPADARDAILRASHRDTNQLRHAKEYAVNRYGLYDVRFDSIMSVLRGASFPAEVPVS